MKSFIKISLLIISTTLFFTSCADISKKVEEKLNMLEQKTNQLDSLVNKEFDKVMALDTLINFESEKIKKLDSLINTSTSKIDSISNNKMKMINNLIK